MKKKTWPGLRCRVLASLDESQSDRLRPADFVLPCWASTSSVESQAGGRRAQTLAASEKPSSRDQKKPKEEPGDLTSKADSEPEETAEEEQPRRRSFLSAVKELLILVIIAYIVAFVVKTFLVQPFKIEQQSMLPTLYPNERVLVNKFIYRLREPERGDIVTFKLRDSKRPGKSRVLIKRIIGTEGEKVQVAKGKVYINGKRIKESYVIDLPDFSSHGPLKIPQDHVFVMGDNRPNSGDSRIFGAVSQEEVLGEAFFVYWPIDRIQVI